MNQQLKFFLESISSVIMVFSAFFLIMVTINSVPLLIITLALLMYQVDGSSALLYSATPFIKFWLALQLIVFCSTIIFLSIRFEEKLKRFVQRKKRK